MKVNTTVEQAYADVADYARRAKAKEAEAKILRNKAAKCLARAKALEQK